MELEEVTHSVEYKYAKARSDNDLPYKMQYFLSIFLGLTQIAFMLLFFFFGSYEEYDHFSKNRYNQLITSNIKEKNVNNFLQNYMFR